MTTTTEAIETGSGTKGARKSSQRAPKVQGDKAKPRQTKRAKLISLLKAKGGRNIAEISKTLGWQQHTTRAALTGLRKAGFTIEREASEGGGAARYSIVAEPEKAPAE